MEVTENQGITDYRSKVVDRMKSRFPERSYESQDGQGGQDDLNQSISEYLDEIDGKLKEYDDNNGRLKNLFNSNPRSAAFLNYWVQSGNPAEAFRRAYGAKAFEAMTSEEGAKIMAELDAEDAKKKAEKDAFDAEVTENFRQSMEAAKAWADSRGLSEDEAMGMFTKLLDILSDAEEGKYSKELFDAAWKAEHYDADIASARSAGEVDGRNARIQESSLRRQAAQQMPPALQGRATRSGENGQEKPRSWGDFLKQ